MLARAPVSGIVAYCSHAHFARHVAPVAAALRTMGVEVDEYSRHGDAGPVMRSSVVQHAELALVANWDDAQRFYKVPLVYLEHGAGQTYVGVDGHGYSGAAGLGHVQLFVCPNDAVAARWRHRYPEASAVTVGCPALDLHSEPSASQRHDDAPEVTPPEGIVAFTFHWRCTICTETMPAAPHYMAALPAVLGALAASGVAVVGTGHPRNRTRYRRMWRDLGVTYVADPDEVLTMLRSTKRAALVADNTSLMYEAAALDIPVLGLNAPWYRRNVHHGLRFWSCVPGAQCDEPEMLFDSIVATLDDNRAAQRFRRNAIAQVYSSVDGGAAERAARAIVRSLGC